MLGPVGKTVQAPINRAPAKTPEREINLWWILI
jgi:hypothetical protein